MGGCTNCFNGCLETVLDKCVKYTGPNIEKLGINNGDTLAAVESAVFTYLISVMSGEGINPLIAKEDICDAIKENLDCFECTEFNLNQLLTAIIKTICSLSTSVEENTQALATLEADYTMGCLDTVSGTEGTHVVVQGLVTALCQTIQGLNELADNLETNYVASSDLDQYINNYLTTNQTYTTITNKMPPYTALPYFGSLSFFDLTGVGLGEWAKIYLCNGQNGTPDLRGRVVVGTTVMGNNAFNSVVDPANPGNPTYNLNTLAGENKITLSVGDLPSHSHPNEIDITDNGHTHDWRFGSERDDSSGGNSAREFTQIAGLNGGLQTSPIKTAETGLEITLTNKSTGGGNAHANIQPVHAAHYIIYIP